MVLLVASAVALLGGCDSGTGMDPDEEDLREVAKMWLGAVDVLVTGGVAPGTFHRLGNVSLDINNSDAMAVDTAAAGYHAILSFNVDVNNGGGWDYSVVLEGPVTMVDGQVHVVGSTPLGTDQGDRAVLDLTPNGDKTQLTGTFTLTHGGEDFTGDVTLDENDGS
jgi:hypothetical protein